MTSSDSKIAKIQTFFQALSSAAPELNAASDSLNQAVTTLDEALKKLNIGLSVWVNFRSRGVEDWEYDDDQIGYDKVDGKWGIAVRRVWGNYNTEEFAGVGPWLFNDAPRDLRLVAVDYLPEAIEALGKAAIETTKKIHEKVTQVRNLTDAIGKKTIEMSFTFEGLTSKQVNDIKATVTKQQKFLGELLEHAYRWELDLHILRILFAPEKRAFAEMVESHDARDRVEKVAASVLGIPVHMSALIQQKPAVLKGVSVGGKQVRS